MSQRLYQLATYHNDGSYDIRDVDLLDLIQKQEKAISKLTEEIMEALDKEEMAHLAKFRDQKLVDYFPSSTGYMVSKMAEGFNSNSPSAGPMAKAAVKTVRAHLSDFKAALEARGVLNDSSDLLYDFEELEYPLEELDKFLHHESSELNVKSGYIFTFFVRHKLERMAEIAGQIDADYAAVSDRSIATNDLSADHGHELKP